MKRESKSLLGAILVILGIWIIAKTLLGITSAILFHGWWTLFIIIPSLLSMKKEGTNRKNIFGLIAGVVLFVNCRTGFLGAIASKIFIPAIIIAIGVRLVANGRLIKK